MEAQKKGCVPTGEAMLVRLTEVCQNTYTVPTADDYTLREVFINPEHVIMIREESHMRQLNEEGKLPKNLNQNHKFTRLTINRGHPGTDIVVVGSPDVIKKNLNKKQILRG